MGKIVDNRNPVNKQAAIVVSKNNDAQRIASTHHKITSSKPIPFIPFHGKWAYLTNKQYGRLTLLGLFIYATKSRKRYRGVRCVCKCSCGRYEVRNIKNIIKDGAFEDALMCHECYLNYKLKEKEYWLKTGMNKCRFCGESFTQEMLTEHMKTKCT